MTPVIKLCVCGKVAVTKLPTASGEMACAQCATMYWGRVVHHGASTTRAVPLAQRVYE